MFSFKLCATVSRFTAQVVRRPRFAFNIRKICYDTVAWTELVDKCEAFTNETDKILHNFFNQGYFTTSNLNLRKNSLDKKFKDALKQLPEESVAALVDTCRIDPKINLEIFNDLLAVLAMNINDDILNDAFAYSNMVRFCSLHKGRDLPLLDAEKIFQVNLTFLSKTSPLIFTF